VRLVAEDGAPVCERCFVADTRWTRMKGLLGRRSLPRDEGLLITKTGSIHMFFMRFPIDAVFLDKDLGIERIASDLKPWRMAAKRGAKQVLELPAGEASRRGLAVGQRLFLCDQKRDEPAES